LFYIFCILLFVLLRIRRSPLSTLFPYTTLFRSIIFYYINVVPSGIRSFNKFGCLFHGMEGSNYDFKTSARRSHQVSLLTNLVRRSEEHTSELQSRENLVCRLLLEKKKKKKVHN